MRPPTNLVFYFANSVPANMTLYDGGDPSLLDSLLSHCRARLPREESRSPGPPRQRNPGFLARARHARGNDRRGWAGAEFASLILRGHE
jgi:hypothetical protein